jgi:SAM-dependent methyltransferase
MIRFICPSYLPRRWMIRSKVFHPSLDRLAELARVPADPAALAAASDEFSRILQNLRLRGVWKWTGRHRLRKMDQLLSGFAGAQGWTQLRMLDIGASDGITTLDAIQHLRQELGIPASATVIDRDTRLLSRRVGAGCTLYFSPAGRPILARWGRLALCLEPMEGLEGLLCNRPAAALARLFSRRLTPADHQAARAIPTINPAVMHEPAIEVRERDLFDPEPAWVGTFDVVRASNVLTLSYYTPEKIREALGIAYRYLRDGGVLVVSRNVIGPESEKEMGGLWQKKGSGFMRGPALDELPEIAELIDGFRP